jgi:hypothetical protein
VQAPNDGPRVGFTVAQVKYLIENTSSFDVTMGMELLDQGLSIIDDISEDLRAASVSRNSYANMHASLTFTIDNQLSWGNSIVRPYMEMTGVTSATDTTLSTMRFYLGAYVTDTPEEDMSLNVSSFDANGYDILSLLDDSIGDGYSVDAGELYLTRVELILQSRGFTKYVIDQDQAAAALTSAKTYTVDDNVTWLTVVNDLLAAVGYAGIWSDHNGYLRAQVYRSPTGRGPEWQMSDNPAVTLLTNRRTRQRDFYDAPNHWVFYRNSTTEGEQPTNDNGLRYEYTNQTGGETSVEARGGRVITKVVGVDAVDATSLQAQAQRTIDADNLIPTTIKIETAPFPLAWHFDRIEVSDAGLGALVQVVATSWSLALDGSDMQWEWTVL